ncbi:MAG: M43 family zinc metalloprotease, partial [Bacteroidota bacterium]
MKNLLIRLALPILLIASAVFLLNGSDQKSLGGEPQRTHYCAQEHIHESWLNQDPSHYFRQEAFERQLRQYMETQSATAERNQPPPYTLPVVVHIVHDGGVENLSDAQILQGIQDLNNAFANTGYYDQGTGVNTEIQFCLARRDPDGNTTNGITRDQDALTDMVIETDDIALKDLNRWEPTSYINIWLVRSITSAFAGPGVAGYAYFPTAHGQPEDGIVMEANFFGSSQGASGVIIHEMGHYLGLYHTFQGGCANNDCLADGDRVCDTPPDQSTAAVPCNASPNSCNTDTDSGFATDQPDMFINYMDYGDFDCYSALTAGQTDRMHFSIENVRQSLLESNGCLDPCTINITADFTASATTINAGESVTFTNSSSNATDYDWQIDGVSFSNDTDPTYQFNNVGTFQVILYATNSDPNCLATDTVSITVNCPTIADFTGAVQFPNVGQTLNFTNTSTGATSYEWLVNGVSQSTNTNFDYTFSISGNYTICLDAVGPFCDDTECATVFVFDNVSDCQSTFIKTFGLPNISDDGFALSESDNGGFFMAGGSGNQSMIIKIDPTGTVAWARTLNLSPQDDQIRDIKLDSDGMMIGCGHGLGGTDVSFFFKYDHINDNILWVRNITNPDSRQLTILEKNPGGNYVATGQMDGCSQASILELDRNNGNIIWHKDYALGNCQTFSKAIIANGSIFTTGRYNFAFGGTNKMRGGISRIDFNGDQIWSRL